MNANARKLSEYIYTHLSISFKPEVEAKIKLREKIDAMSIMVVSYLTETMVIDNKKESDIFIDFSYKDKNGSTQHGQINLAHVSHVIGTLKTIEAKFEALKDHIKII